MPKDLPSILREFEEKFLVSPDELSSDRQFKPEVSGRLPELFKSLLTQVYSAGAEQERKKLGEVIEGMKIEGKDLNRNGIGYNEALSDLLSSLNQGK